LSQKGKYQRKLKKIQPFGKLLVNKKGLTYEKEVGQNNVSDVPKV